MIDTVLFDLDGTLLPMDQDEFVKTYLGLLAAYMSAYDYEPKRLVKAVWDGTGAMVKNDGKKTNEEVFWDVFSAEFGPRAMADLPVFDEFYATEFAKARTVCGFAPEAAEVITMLKEKGKRCVLATNPLFPRIATLQRIRWAGLDPEDFELVTTYENAGFCKPNPEYYREILRKIGAEPENCLMVGNDVREDMIARELGMKVFLLEDCLLHAEGRDLSAYPRGGFDALKAFLREI